MAPYRSGVDAAGRHRHRAVALAIILAGTQTARAAPVSIAVAAFDYADTSGEVQDNAAAHTALLQGLSAAIQFELARGGRFEAAPLHCAAPVCSAAALDQDDMRKAAEAQHVRYLVFGGVHKMSTLIQWGQIDVMDVRNGRTALARTISFRGDSVDAWQHAAAYIGQALLEGLR